MPAGAIIGGGVQMIGSLIGGAAAKRAAKRLARQRRRLEKKLNSLEEGRQQIVNPYKDSKSLAGFAQDLSSQITNPFANLGVATKSAEIQMEQSDIALANTLDTLRATGASAGGATALAQAALKSKQGVAASLESQEAQNDKLRAQGEQQMQRAQMAEKARIQGIQISEGGREQGAQGQGKAFELQMKENRQQGRIDRVAGQINSLMGAEAQANADSTGSMLSGLGGLGQLAGGMFSE